MLIIYTPQFKRSFKKLPQQLQQEAWKLLQLFKTNPAYPGLKTHKLKNTDIFSFSITYKIRIIFTRDHNKYILINIGDHSLYRKL